MKTESIGNLVGRVRQFDPAKLGRDSFRYIDISSLDRDSKCLLAPERISVSVAPSRARQLVQAGDVLISTVRPNLNAVAQVPSHYDGEIASTGFCILRPDSAQVDPRFLFYFTQTSRFVAQLMRVATGASYPAVTDSDVFETRIPFPPLSEQQRIAGVLEQADRLRRTRRYALELSDSFLPAAFRQLFGDPIVKRERWPATTLTELIRAGGKINYGVVQPGTETRLGVPIVRVADMDDLDSSLPHLKRVAREIDEQHSASRLKGDEILIACVGATLGKIVSARPSMKDFNIARAVARVPADWTRTNREFLAHYLLSPKVQSFWLKETRTVGQPTLNITQIEETPVVFPPLALQQQFASQVSRHERLRSVQRESLRQAEHRPQTLLHRAFTTGL